MVWVLLKSCLAPEYRYWVFKKTTSNYRPRWRWNGLKVLLWLTSTDGQTMSHQDQPLDPCTIWSLMIGLWSKTWGERTEQKTPTKRKKQSTHGLPQGSKKAKTQKQSHMNSYTRLTWLGRLTLLHKTNWHKPKGDVDYTVVEKNFWTPHALWNIALRITQFLLVQSQPKYEKFNT